MVGITPTPDPKQLNCSIMPASITFFTLSNSLVLVTVSFCHSDTHSHISIPVSCCHSRVDGSQSITVSVQMSQLVAMSVACLPRCLTVAISVVCLPRCHSQAVAYPFALVGLFVQAAHSSPSAADQVDACSFAGACPVFHLQCPRVSDKKSNHTCSPHRACTCSARSSEGAH